MDRAGDLKVKLSVPGSTASRGKVLEAVERACRAFTASQERRTDVFINEMVSAVGEAFNNIAIHAYDDNNRRSVHVEISCDDDFVTTTLKDFGVAFRPRPHVDLDFTCMGTRDLPESGMGMFIMRAFVDEIVYTPGTPNVLQLRKRVA
jgi:serine/threonine-protein kinase RsbW